MGTSSQPLGDLLSTTVGTSLPNGTYTRGPGTVFDQDTTVLTLSSMNANDDVGIDAADLIQKFIPKKGF
jgi:hypothetical protein